ncbi:MAG: hemin-degrading factor [Rhodospirillales bacterium]|nr:MAG: hemin-degrading factor [Rhodospirillales bacterium]
MHTATEADAGIIRDRFHALQKERPNARARDLADALDLSEGQVVAARCGDGVARLAPRWHDLLLGLTAVGPVMALTRNEYAVHEKIGTYGNVELSIGTGLVLDPDIDLRIFFDHWAHAFAVTETRNGQALTSIQVFDRDGTAVHKVYVQGETDRSAWDRLVADLTADDQTPGMAVTPLPPVRRDRPDAHVDAEALRGKWRALTDTHDFFPMLKDLDVGRVQAFRLVGREFAEPVGDDAFAVALHRAAATAVPIMIFVGNPGVIQIHSGPVGTVREMGEWLNVLDPGFNLHLRTTGVTERWLVRKPTSDGIVTSLELFDANGRQIAWMFGQRKPGVPERTEWRVLAESLAKAAA